MTIPLSPASERRGPRETLLALTAVYLRSGKLEPEARRSVARLAARVRAPAPHIGGASAAGEPGPASAPDGSVVETAASAAAPEWGPLACALAAMLRGEVEHTLGVVGDAVRTDRVPEALRVALLGLGVRAALAADRPALAARWRAGLRLQRQLGPKRKETRPDLDERFTRGPSGPPRRASGGGVPGAVPEDARDDAAFEPGYPGADEAVLASLPVAVRELLACTLDEGGWMGGLVRPEPPPPAGAGSNAGPSAGSGGDPDGGRAAGRGAGRGADRGAEPGADRDADRDAERGTDPGVDARVREVRGAATLHVVMDAYHGDVVSVPVHVEVLAWKPSELVDEDDDLQAEPGRGAGAGAPSEASATAWGAEIGWEAEGLPLLTVRVAAGDELPEAPDTEGWHLRFVGRLRALDARTSDGSLLELAWEDGGFVATFHPPEWLEELPDAPPVVATRVTHVVLVPESDVGDLAHGAGPRT